MSGKGGNGLTAGAVCHIDLAVAGAARDERLRVAHEGEVAYRAVMHRQLGLLLAATAPGDVVKAFLRVEAHDLDRLIVGASRDEIAQRVPCEAIDGAFVVAGAFHQHLNLRGPVQCDY